MNASRRQYSSLARTVCASLALLLGSSPSFAGNPPVLSPEIQRELKTKFPGLKVVKWCGDKVLGSPTNAVVVLHDPATAKFLVVWVMPTKEIQELDSVAAGSPEDFELQCLNAREAVERQSVLRHSEAIVSSLKVPAGTGAVCYFTDNTTAKCWSVDRSTGRMKEVGGWQT